MTKIDPDAHYLPTSPELGKLARPQTFAKWRHEGRGPAYHKAGHHVVYLGRDVLEWLARNRIETDRGGQS